MMIAAILQLLPWNKKLIAQKEALTEILVEKNAKISEMEASIHTFRSKIQNAKAEVESKSKQYWMSVHEIENKICCAGARILKLESNLRNSEKENLEKSLQLNKCSFQLQRANVENKKAALKLNVKSISLENLAQLVQKLKQESRILQEMLGQVGILPTFECQMLYYPSSLTAHQAEGKLLDLEKKHKEEMNENLQQHTTLVAKLKQEHAIQIYEAEQKAVKMWRRHQMHESLFENLQTDCKKANARIAELEKKLQESKRESHCDFRGGHFRGFPQMQSKPFQVNDANTFEPSASNNEKGKKREPTAQKVEKGRGRFGALLVSDTMQNDGTPKLPTQF